MNIAINHNVKKTKPVKKTHPRLALKRIKEFISLTGNYIKERSDELRGDTPLIKWTADKKIYGKNRFRYIFCNTENVEVASLDARVQVYLNMVFNFNHEKTNKIMTDIKRHLLLNIKSFFKDVTPYKVALTSNLTMQTLYNYNRIDENSDDEVNDFSIASYAYVITDLDDNFDMMDLYEILQDKIKEHT